MRDLGDAYLLQRHGWGGYTAPHLVDHVANLRALVALGCDRILAVNSSGSLRTSFGIGTFVLADDFVALGPTPSTFTDERGHRVPGFDAAWRARILDAWRSGTEVPLHDGGVYWQATGPRLETAAEIRVFAHHADVVGMTMASECVVAGELGLAYASVCVVDNLASGLRSGPLTGRELAAGRDAHAGRPGEGARRDRAVAGGSELVELERRRVLAAALRARVARAVPRRNASGSKS